VKGHVKTKITQKLKRKMGLYYVNGILTDMYGRTFEIYTDSDGYEDMRPNGVQRNMKKYYEIRNQMRGKG